MQQPNNPLRAIAALLVASAASFAFAEPPMNVDDAGTLAKGGTKIEGVLARDDRERSAELGFGYGLIEHVEVGLAFTHATDRADDPATKLRGMGIGIKWVPIQNDSGWSFGVSVGYDHVRVNVRATPDKFTSRVYALSGLATFRFEDGQVAHLNLGTQRTKAQGERDSVGTWGVGYEYPLAENLKLTAEVFGEEGSRPDKALGLRYEVFAGFKLSGAIGRGNDRHFGQVGFAWEF